MKNNKFLLCIVTVLLTASLLLTGCSDGPSASSGTSEPSGSSVSSGSGRTSGSSGESSGSSSDSETPEPGKLELFYEVSGGTATVTGVRGKPDGTVTIPEKDPGWCHGCPHRQLCILQQRYHRHHTARHHYLHW